MALEITEKLEITISWKCPKDGHYDSVKVSPKKFRQEILEIDYTECECCGVNFKTKFFVKCGCGDYHDTTELEKWEEK